MGAINPQKVALKVCETIAKNKLVDLEDIIISEGYAKSTAHNSYLVTRTKAYKATMAIQSQPLLEKLQGEINRAKLALSKIDLSTQSYRELVYGLDILIKNYQLLSGGATERQVFVLPSQVIDKNNIVIDNDSKLLSSDTNKT